MLCSRLVFLLTVLLHPFLHAAALRSQLRGHVISPQLWKRDHISALDNSQNLLYYTNITLGEKQLSVSIDTGRHVVLPLFLSSCLNFQFSPVLIYGLWTTFSTRTTLASPLAFNMPSVTFLAT